jgi:hypothetical protein
MDNGGDKYSGTAQYVVGMFWHQKVPLSNIVAPDNCFLLGLFCFNNYTSQPVIKP